MMVDRTLLKQLASTFAKILYTLPNKLIGRKSFTLTALALLGISDKK
jgi:hypothetical protein